MNITKLLIWNELQALGFETINFRGHGRVLSIGCAIRKKHTDKNGKDFYSDIICIEPVTSSHSDGRNYHITGDIKTPYIDKFYRYEFGRKVEFFETVTHINNHYTAKQILAVVKKMLA